jgi:hypothetical protein
MKLVKLAILGLWFGLLQIIIMAIGESIFPGSLNDTAFTNLGIIIILAIGVMDFIFSFGGVD